MQQLRGVRWASSIRLGDLPLVAIAMGPRGARSRGLTAHAASAHSTDPCATGANAKER
jgi:hypothetical protein